MGFSLFSSETDWDLLLEIFFGFPQDASALHKYCTHLNQSQTGTIQWNMSTWNTFVGRTLLYVECLLQSNFLVFKYRGEFPYVEYLCKLNIFSWFVKGIWLMHVQLQV